MCSKKYCHWCLVYKTLSMISFPTQVCWIKVEAVLVWLLFPTLDLNVSFPLKRRADYGLEIRVDQPSDMKVGTPLEVGRDII